VNGYIARYQVADDGSLTLDNPACIGTYRYDQSGDTLRLRVVKQCSGHEEPYNTTLFATFPFTRSS